MRLPFLHLLSAPDKLSREKLSPEQYLRSNNRRSNRRWSNCPLGSNYPKNGATVIGAIIAWTFIVGAMISDRSNCRRRTQRRSIIIIIVFFFVGVNFAGVNFAGAIVEDHLLRSNWRLQGSKCCRSNSRRSIILSYYCNPYVTTQVS